MEIEYLGKCEYAIQGNEPSGRTIVDCDEPAVARVSYSHPDEPILVCKRHLEKLKDDAERVGDEAPREELKAELVRLRRFLIKLQHSVFSVYGELLPGQVYVDAFQALENIKNDCAKKG